MSKIFQTVAPSGDVLWTGQRKRRLDVSVPATKHPGPGPGPEPEPGPYFSGQRWRGGAGVGFKAVLV